MKAGKNMRKPGSEVKRAGEKTRKTGEKMRKPGSEVKRAGQKTRKTGKKMRKPGSEVKRAGEKTRKTGKKIKKAGSEVKKVGKKIRKEGQKMSEAGERVNKCACNRRVILTSAIIFGRKVVTSRRLSIFVAAIEGKNHLSGERTCPFASRRLRFRRKNTIDTTISIQYDFGRTS